MPRRRLIALIAIWAAVVFIVGWTLRPIERPFDAAAWNDEVRVEDGVRLAMADHLVAQRTLWGKSRAELVAMLGEPPQTGYFSDRDLVYWLGPERGFVSIDSEWLVVRLDAGQRVADCRIVRD